MDFNPFRSVGATQQTVQEDTTTKEGYGGTSFNMKAMSKMKPQAKADDDTVRMMKANPNMMKKGGPGGMKGLNKKAQKDVKKAMKDDVNESKFVIPEEIPANERTAFHGAAAAAAKAGKSHFNFGGKKHPVTMAKDTAHKIADQKESVEENLMLKNPYKDKKYSKDDLQRKHGSFKRQLADLQNKKMRAAMGSGASRGHYDSEIDSMQTKLKQVRHAMKEMDEGYYKDQEIRKQDKEMGAKPVPAKKKKEAKGGGKEGDVEMNPKMETGKTEQKESHIRTALKSVLVEKENHSPNQDKAEKMKDNRKGKGAEDMMAPADDAIANPAIDEPDRIKKDMAKMTSNVKKAPMRKGDKPQGDSKIVPGGTPMKDPAAMKAESTDINAGLKAAYASMYETKTEEVKDD